MPHDVTKAMGSSGPSASWNAARSSPPRKWPHPSPLAWAVVIAALISSWMDFGRLHQFANSDSIVPVLASLMRWSVFFWGQNRFGMLIPLLATFIHSPFANLLFQAWLSTFAGVLASFLLLRYVLGKGPTWFAAGALVNLTAFCVVPLGFQWDWFCNQPYGVSLALAFSGFILLEKASRVGCMFAIVLVFLAHWVNVSLPLLLVPLVILHYLAENKRSDLTRLLPCLALGALGGWLLMRTARYSGWTDQDVIPVSEWPSAWAQLFRKAHETMLPHAFQLLWLISAVAVLILLLAVPVFRTRRYSRLAAVLGAVGLMNWLVIGTLRWVQVNHYWPRYTYSAMLFGMAGLAILEVPLLEKGVGSKRATAAISILMFACVGLRYGCPSAAQVRRDFDQRFGRMTEQVLATRATVIAGAYWTVWPAVFHANQVLHEQGLREIVYGLTYRSSTTDPLWADAPRNELCVAAPPGDTEASKYMDFASVHFSRVENHGTVDIFKLGDESSCHRFSKTETALQRVYKHLHRQF